MLPLPRIRTALLYRNDVWQILFVAFTARRPGGVCCTQFVEADAR